MRITNRMMNDNVLRNLHAGLERLATYNQQLSSEKRISRAHEDPVIARKSMGLNSNLTEVEQYTRNIDEGLSWLEITDSAIGQVVDTVQQIRDAAVRGANGALEQPDLNAIKSQVEQALEHLISLSETKYNQKYIFSGTATLTKPFDATLAYQGDNQSMDCEVSKGVRVGVNIAGDELFDSIFAAANDLIAHLTSGDQSAVSSDIGQIDSALNNALDIHSKVGSITNRLDLGKTRLQDDTVNVNKLLSETEDVDIAKVIMELKMQENVYQASLGSAARIIQPSLLDFLR